MPVDYGNFEGEPAKRPLPAPGAKDFAQPQFGCASDFSAFAEPRGQSFALFIAKRGPADDIAFDPPRGSIESRGVDLG